MLAAAQSRSRSDSSPAHRAEQRTDGASRTIQRTNPLWAGFALAGGAPVTVSRPDDPSERQAERIAEQITRSPVSQVQRSCAACAAAAEPRSDYDAALYLRRSAAGVSHARPGAPIVVPTGPGKPLDARTRGWFEPRLGADLSTVRIHTDAAAGRAAHDLGAHAFTLGQHIAFAHGRYEPNSAPGRQLLAHELVHVLQAGAAANTGDASVVHRSVVPAGPPREMPVPGGEGPGGGGLAAPAPAPPRPPPIPRPETCPPPEDMLCPPAMSTPGAVTNTLIFSVNSATLNATQKAEIDAAAASWRAAGASVMVRIDGYASAEGECGYNWNLSCRRAEAVAGELKTPSDGSPGVPGGDVEVFAHGESDEAGRALAPNRRATISIPIAPPTPQPPSPPACALPVLLGTGRTGCGSGTDFTHFDFPSISLSSDLKLAAWAAAHPPIGTRMSRSAITDVECEAEMDGVLVGTAGGAGHAAFSRFAAGTGGTETLGASSTLGALALTSPSFLATTRTVQASIETQLAAMAPSGVLDACALSVTPPQTHFSLGGPDPLALQAVIGGTHGERLFADAFTGSIPMRSYSIDLRFLICDNFGVDEHDLYAPGLMAFWVLQHERSATLYAPFINELELPVTVSGTF